ncbi:MAG: cyclophilin-like family protein [Candidatus Odinarchaeota archaeon]
MSIDHVLIRLYPTKDQYTTLRLKRHLAPRTVSLLVRTVRDVTSQARVVKRPGEISILLKIGRVGPEKARKDIKKNEVAYWPQGNMLMLFSETKASFNPVNVIGTVDNLIIFDKIRSGSMIRLQLVSEDEDTQYYEDDVVKGE